jgi:hypothetical protein
METCMERFVDDSLSFAKWARDSAYCRVAISAGHDAAATTCTVLVVHMPDDKLSFAKPGDERWTLLSGELYLDDVRYNDRDGMFYGLRFDGSVYNAAFLQNRETRISNRIVRPQIVSGRHKVRKTSFSTLWRPDSISNRCMQPVHQDWCLIFCKNDPELFKIIIRWSF